MAYLYSTQLDPGQMQIRLLTLFDGAWDDAIRCKLDVVSLNDPDRPPYEALSYVWGSETDPMHIDIDGNPFPATRNLHAALRRLRERIHSTGGKDRTLWIDAAEEKRWQVYLMGDIDTQTVRGLLWLGEEPEEPQPIVSKEQNDEVASLLKESGSVLDDIAAFLPNLDLAGLSAMPEVELQPGAHDFHIRRTRPEHWLPGFNRDNLDDAGRAALEADSMYQVYLLLEMLASGAHLRWVVHLQDQPSDAPATFRTNTRQALHWLVTGPWWSRIWTVQECIFPRQCELLYGPVRIPFCLLLSAVSNFQKHSTSCCADVPGVNNMLNLLVNTVLPLDTLHRCSRTKDFKTSQFPDDHDSPFDISSLCQPRRSNSNCQAIGATIMPDYSPGTTFERVFTTAVFSIIKSGASLDVIYQPGDVSRDHNSRLPSWVPDFSKPVTFAGSLDRYLRQLSYYDASAGRGASASVIEENILVLEGCLVDSIASTSSRMVYLREEPQRSVFRDWYQFAKDFYEKATQSDVTSATGNHTTDWKKRFWRSLCGDTVATKQRVQQQEDFKAPLRKIDTSSSPEHGPMFAEAVYNSWCLAQGLDELATTPQPSNNDAMGEYTVGSVSYAIKISTASRRMFVSSKGHLGLGPPTAGLTYPQKDRIFVFPGSRMPLVLRYVGMRHVPGLGMQSCHELIGDCYLDGLMDGEGMRKFEGEKQTVYLV
ncbi:heterokaryon incompatibility protein-domain-containing protein [Xylariaceae sp. FL0255]|nr:heterokaryon incompatibility protein-domain-containing protein [Xylariaceae sp. FL0255]